MATSYLSTRVTVATEQDAKKLDRVMKYLNNTRGAGLVLEGAGSLVVRAYIDAAHGVHEDGMGHQGLFVTLGMGLVMAKSRKQKVQCKSSTETELVALSDFVEQVKWVKDYLEAQGHKTGPARVYQDNTSTMAKVKQDSLSGKDRKKHFKKRRLLVKDSVDEKIVTLKYLPTEAMVADLLTKPLQGQLFKRLRMAMINCDDSLCGGVSVNMISDIAKASNIINNVNNKESKNNNRIKPRQRQTATNRELGKSQFGKQR